MKKGRKIKKVVSYILIFTLIFTSMNFMSLSSTYALSENLEDIIVNLKQDIDVVLSVGNSSVDVTNFEAQLKEKLKERGIPTDNIKISALEVKDVDAKNNFAWKTYDHTNKLELEDKENGLYYYGERNGNYTLDNHIVISDKNIDMYGYGSPAFKDFMYMSDHMATKKTFDFIIKEGEFYDALEGAGFLFNTNITGTYPDQTMSGYLILIRYTGSRTPVYAEIFKFENIDVEGFHNDRPGTVTSDRRSAPMNPRYPGFTQLAYCQLPTGDKIRKIKIDTSSSKFKMEYGGASNENDAINSELLNWKNATDGTDLGSEISLTSDYKSYGFGPIISYRSHGCSRHTHFTFNNITMSTEIVKKFVEIIREPEWRDNSKKFIVNLEDNIVEDFNDDVPLGEILSRLGNDEIHYIGWGTDTNKNQGEEFIKKNSKRGTFVKNTDSDSIDKIAAYIAGQYADGLKEGKDIQYITYGNDVEFDIRPESVKSDTAGGKFPVGRWKVDHDPTVFENSSKVVPYDGQYLNDLDVCFNEIGQYDISYEDTVVNTVYVHRKPMASFHVSVDNENKVSIIDKSYDLDGGLSSGIAQREWQWKEVSAGGWNSGQPNPLEANKNYVIQLRVKDHQDTWSTPCVRYVTTASKDVAPIAEFFVSPQTLYTYEGNTVKITETSYNPDGKLDGSLIKEWKVTKGGKEIYSGSKPKITFDQAGEYKIALRVKKPNPSQEGKYFESQWFARYINIVEDTEAPTKPEVEMKTISDSKTYTSGEWTSDGVSVMLSGSTDASQFIKYQYKIGDDEWVEGNSTMVNTEGTTTVSYRAEDIAGNVSNTESVTINIDKTEPQKPLIKKDPDRDFYKDEITIKISSTDDESGIEKVEYRLNGSSWKTYNGLFKISKSGTTTVEARAIDKAGNESKLGKTDVCINKDIYASAKIEINPDKEYHNDNFLVTLITEIDDQHVTDSVYGSVYSAVYCDTYYKLSDMSDFKLYKEPFTITEEGQTDISVKVEDRFGNESDEIKKTVYIDRKAPENQDEVLKENIAKKGKESIVIIPTGDETETIWIAPLGTKKFEEGNSITKTSGDDTLINVPEKEGKYRVYVEDRVGNVSEPSSAVIIVDNTPPTVEGVEDEKTYKEYRTIKFSDGTAKLNDIPFTKGHVVGANGAYKLVVTDAAGNITTIEFIIDNDEEWVKKDKEMTQIGYAQGDNKDWVSNDLKLSTQGNNGSSIRWQSSNEAIITSDGKVTLQSEPTFVILTAIITKGNATETIVFKVRVVTDRIKPILELKGDRVVTIEQGQLYEEKGYTAIDNVDGDITNKVEIEGFVDSDRVGYYTLTYTVKDVAGNEGIEQRFIHVVKDEVDKEATIIADNEEDVLDKKVTDAIEGAKQHNERKIKIVVKEKATIEEPVRVTISKEQVKNAQQNELSLVFEAKDTSIEVPLKAVDTSSMPTNSKLALVCEQVDTSKPENRKMEDAVKNINKNMGIYEKKIYDFKMEIVEVDAEGNKIKSEEIENFTSEEDIKLRIVVGKDIEGDTRFMTFYYNEKNNEWEYIRGEYNRETGDMTILTNHLSIYSVMNLSLAEKKEAMAQIFNKPNVTIKEGLSVIEDPDMEFDSEAVEKYKTLTKLHRENIVQQLIDERPEDLYNYIKLSEKYKEVVIGKHDSIQGDNIAPEITLKGEKEVTIKRNRLYIEQGATAKDNLDGDITGRIILIGSVDTSKTGVYTLRYTIEDSNGNKAEVTRTVIVKSSRSGSSKNTSKNTSTSANTTIEPQKDSQIKIVEGEENTKTQEVSSGNLKPKEKEMKIVGSVYKVTPIKNNGQVDASIRIGYDETKVSNEDRLAVYVYDEESKAWQCLGGIVDKKNNQITVKVKDTAKIAVMEYNKTFKDLEGHWSQEIVELLASRQIISGDITGNFNPNMGITRAEFATLIVKILNLKVGEKATGFHDIKEDDWFAPYIATARKSGVVRGVSETEYEPHRIVNREEMASIVMRAYELAEEEKVSNQDISKESKFADSEQISNWAYKDIYAAKSLKLIRGRDENRYVPKNETLRAEAAALIYNFLKAQGRI
ncbi:MAG: DUF5011 domain-containing protein [Anaeromicrobium sp.]|uniref:OmpL47-type beta-barrel domain-containing protein n=1 Tax=Anaeromicrobium sp. TaxID=1929132 RepID=UPI0025D8E622|nr:immunoglobulin-like domain-containing protein [Anaeromicrobium sp.]MCT4593256.1 DUF5011 domain-containing protein [Anaeromicrobium sp.]